MRRHVFFVFVMLAMVLCTMADFNNAQAQCRTNASCYAGDDTGYYILDYDGHYTPCDNSIAWSLSVNRTLQSGYPSYLRTSITGDLFLVDYDSENYTSGGHDFSGTQYVGTGTQTLFLKRIGENDGNFTEMKLEVNYYAGEPD